MVKRRDYQKRTYNSHGNSTNNSGSTSNGPGSPSGFVQRPSREQNPYRDREQSSHRDRNQISGRDRDQSFYRERENISTRIPNRSGSSRQNYQQSQYSASRNMMKYRAEETVDDIREDIARLEKEIDLEIKEIRSMKL